jgi:hypothetical protein
MPRRRVFGCRVQHTSKHSAQQPGRRQYIAKRVSVRAAIASGWLGHDRIAKRVVGRPLTSVRSMSISQGVETLSRPAGCIRHRLCSGAAEYLTLSREARKHAQHVQLRQRLPPPKPLAVEAACLAARAAAAARQLLELQLHVQVPVQVCASGSGGEEMLHPYVPEPSRGTC